jgi:hypothetical protein
MYVQWHVSVIVTSTRLEVQLRIRREQTQQPTWHSHALQCDSPIFPTPKGRLHPSARRAQDHKHTVVIESNRSMNEVCSAVPAVEEQDTSRNSRPRPHLLAPQYTSRFKKTSTSSTARFITACRNCSYAKAVTTSCSHQSNF